jgi:hypothetical protein
MVMLGLKDVAQQIGPHAAPWNGQCVRGSCRTQNKDRTIKELECCSFQVPRRKMPSLPGKHHSASAEPKVGACPLFALLQVCLQVARP